MLMVTLGMALSHLQGAWWGLFAFFVMENMGQQMPWRQKMPGSAAPGARHGTTMVVLKLPSFVPAVTQSGFKGNPKIGFELQTTHCS